MPEHQFAFTAPESLVFEVSAETRTIKGLVLPYGAVGTPRQGGKFTFSKGSVQLPADPKRVKLLISHDFSRAVGHAVQFEDTDAGVLGTFKVARGADGDTALSMAEDGVWDGFSVGIGATAKFRAGRGGISSAVSADFAEVSLTPLPGFADARVTSVAASAVPNDKENAMPEETVVEETPTTEEAGAQFSAETLTAAVTDGVRAAFTALEEVGGVVRPVVPAGRPTVEVREESLYRFDGIGGAHDFSSDLIAGMGLNGSAPDGEALERVMGFMAEQLGPQFVTTANTSAVNPSGYRPDMFVNEQRLNTPLYNAFYKGALTDVSPFSFSKFSSASGLVGDHTEGVEPTAGSYSTATGATITPAPVSGKVHITREVADQGGNPQVSGLIWSKIEYEYKKAMEAKVAALLAAATPAEFGAAIAAGAATVPALATPIEQAIAKLNFIAGGDRFNYVATHIDLYLALSSLRDGEDRPYYPIIGPANANGGTVAGFKSLNVAGTRFDPVWSIGTTSDGTAHKSYLADTSAVYFWASAPQRLDRLKEDVEGYDLGVWGYQAGVVADPSGLLKITYDPT